MACRSGCLTKDCGSYAACCRNSGMRVAYTNSAGGWDASKQKRWDGELERFRGMEAAGLNPLGTTHAEMDRTERTVDAYTKVTDTIATGDF